MTNSELSRELKRLRVRIERQLLPLLPDYDERQELTQRCLIKVWTKAHTFRGYARFTTWVYTVVRNEYGSWRRTEARQADRLRDLHWRAVPPSESSDPSERALTRISVHRLLNEMDATDRLIFELRCLRDMTSVEVGAIVRLSPGSVRSRSSRAVASIRASRSAANSPP